MISVLIKKQIYEVYSFLFYDSRKGKKRMGAGKIGYWLLLLSLFGFLMGAFFMFSMYMGGALFAAHLEWIYFILLSSISVALGVFGSVFNTFSTLYLAHDNELLLSLPIKKRDLLISRMAGVYALGVFYMAIVYIPSMIASWILGFSFQMLFGEIVVFILLSIFVCALSVLLGWVVALINVRLKNKAFITVFISLVLIAAYYYVYFSVINSIQDLIQLVVTSSDALRHNSFLFLINHLGFAATGQLSSIVIQCVFHFVFMGIVYLLVYNNYDKILTMNKGEKRVDYNQKKIVQKSVSQSLFKKEWLRFSSSATYMLNCGIGILFAFVAGIGILWKQDVLLTTLYQLGIQSKYYIIFVCVLIGFITTSSPISAVSISLEGKSMWILKSLPIDEFEILWTKTKFQFLITILPNLFLGICTCLAFQLSINQIMVVIVFSIGMDLLHSLLGVVLNLWKPNLNWQNESAVIKQGMPVIISLFGGWLFSMGIGIVYYFIYSYITAFVYIVLVLVLICISSILSYIWLQRKGVNLFKNL